MLKPKKKDTTNKDAAKTAFQKRVYEAEGWTLSFDKDGIPTLSGKGDVNVITDGDIFARTASGQGSKLSKPNIIRPESVKPSVYIGQHIEGKGIYHGRVTLPPRYSVTLPSMHLWVAPHDMPHVNNKRARSKGITFTEANAVIGALDDSPENAWGRPGKRMAINPPEFRNYERDLYQYLDNVASTQSESGWFIPTKEIMDGRVMGERAVSLQNSLVSHSTSMPYGSEYTDIRERLLVKPYGSCTVTRGNQAFAMHLGEGTRDRTTYDSNKRILFRPVALDMKL